MEAKKMVYDAISDAVEIANNETERNQFLDLHKIHRRMGLPYRIFLHLLVERWQPRVFVEHGTGSGWTSRLVSIACLDTNVVTIDVKENPCGKVLDPCENVTRFIADVLAASTLKDVLAEIRGSTIDVLFVDGLHDSDSVEMELTLWRPFMADPGLICFDDVDCPRAYRSLRALWKWLRHNDPAYETINALHPPVGFGIAFIGDQWQ
jgi:predicted O-methyltransferase YrrM